MLVHFIELDLDLSWTKRKPRRAFPSAAGGVMQQLERDGWALFCTMPAPESSWEGHAPPHWLVNQSWCCDGSRGGTDVP